MVFDDFSERSRFGRGDTDDFAVSAEERGVVGKTALLIRHGGFDALFDEGVGEEDFFGAHVLDDGHVHAPQKFLAYVRF